MIIATFTLSVGIGANVTQVADGKPWSGCVGAVGGLVIAYIGTELLKCGASCFILLFSEHQRSECN